MYASVIVRREQAKLEEESRQKLKNIIVRDNSDVFAEDQEYQKKVKWMKDQEKLNGEERKNPETNPLAMKSLPPDIRLWYQ
jgi:hypothetical protein